MPTPAIDSYDAYVDADAVLAYALATNDPNEMCITGVKASPLVTAPHVVRAFIETNTKAVPEGTITGTRAGVHAMHDVHYLRPIELGSMVRDEGRNQSVKQTSAGVSITSDLRVLNQDGELLLQHFWSMARLRLRTHSLTTLGIVYLVHSPSTSRAIKVSDTAAHQAIETAMPSMIRLPGQKASQARSFKGYVPLP